MPNPNTFKALSKMIMSFQWFIITDMNYKMVH